ncbi:MAG: tripartite tricarboxylate transporter substrate binding protein [Candidatus Methanomethylicus sp.]|nr:tripartite tricarboxylate transporter substrate binding protein [Candidatus Methanomethylicus sp.]
MARAIATAAEKIAGVPIVVVNKPGAGGLAGIPEFLGAPSDGYTLLQHTDNLVTMYASKKSDLNPATLIPLFIGEIAVTQLFINAKDDRFRTEGKPDFGKVLEYARAKPGQLSMASYGGINTQEGVILAMLEKRLGFTSKNISFDKPSERYSAIIGKHLDVLLEQPGDVSQLVEANEILPVLSIWPTRFKDFPDVKCTGEYGIDWQPVMRWRSLFIKPDTPPEIVKYLQDVLKKAWETPAHQEYLKKKKLDIVPSYRTTEETLKIINREIEVYSSMYKELGLPSR